MLKMMHAHLYSGGSKVQISLTIWKLLQQVETLRECSLGTQGQKPTLGGILTGSGTNLINYS